MTNVSRIQVALPSCCKYYIPVKVRFLHFFTLQVTQVYISWPAGITPAPPQLQLVNFIRTEELAAQSLVHLSFIITPRVRAVYSDKYVIMPGVYKVYIGGQQPGQKTQVSSNVLQGSFTISGEVTPLSSCKYPG